MKDTTQAQTFNMNNIVRNGVLENQQRFHKK